MLRRSIGLKIMDERLGKKKNHRRRRSGIGRRKKKLKWKEMETNQREGMKKEGEARILTFLTHGVFESGHQPVRRQRLRGVRSSVL